MGETLRIAFVYDVVYPWVKGGVEKRIYELAKRLTRSHEVHVYGYHHWKGPKEIEREGITYHGTIRPRAIYSSGRRATLPPLLHSLKLLPLLKQEHFDVLDCQAAPYFTCYSSIASPSSMVITWHEFWGDYWLEYLGMAGITGKKIERGLFSFKNHIAVSQKTRLDLLDAGLRKSIQVIPNGISVSEIRKVKPSDLSSDFIFVGRLIPEKNVTFLLRVFAHIKMEMPDFNAVIIGDGPERDKLEKLCKDLGLENNVAFLGFLKNSLEVISHMKASKVFVFPSIREGFGMVVLEAMASGLPVVTLNHPMNASKFLVKNGRSGFVANFNENEFGEKILNAFDSSLKLGKIAQESSVSFDWDVIVTRLQGLYSMISGG